MDALSTLQCGSSFFRINVSFLTIPPTPSLLLLVRHAIRGSAGAFFIFPFSYNAACFFCSDASSPVLLFT